MKSTMAAKVPIVGECCLCFDLKTGTIILGVLNLIVCVIGAILSIGLVIRWAVFVGDGDVIMKENGVAVNPGLVEAVGIVLYITTSVIFIVCVFYIVIASLLIHGARTGRPGFLTPWLVLTAVSMALQLVNVVGGLIALEWMKVVLTIIGMTIEGYFFVCVWSFRQQLPQGVFVPKA
eukprot:GFUD01027116.1.p1 GENE.GFUD01027116.1~~GFUD01027116.1.p1  ORF type:complete len:177 (+),score=20.52 GFUD01027116.1:77-607(+)